MSRSTKKPYVKMPSDKDAKKLANRAVRRATKVPDGKSFKKCYNSWNICDWKWYEPKNKKATRK